MKTTQELIVKLKSLSACKEAMQWLGNRDEAQMLADCHRGDWLLWYFFRLRKEPGYPDIRKITLVKARCAKIVIHLMKDERSINAVEVAERYGIGEATDEELQDAANAAADAYAAADAAAAAANAAADAAYAAADAATKAAYAAANAAADAFKNKKEEVLFQCAELCREILYIPQ